MSEFPRISFGIIVLNGEPFTRYCLRSLYPFAFEIIIVEGGHEDTKAVTTPDGHSIDGTLETLYRFKKEEDIENKVQIITRDGFWTKRDELGRDRTHQSRAYSERATGDYLWQVDIDEFYRTEDMLKIITMLRNDPSITQISFPVHTFWARPAYVVDGWKRRRGDPFNRLFKWGPGYQYVTHEPPTVIDNTGRDLINLHWITAKQMAHKGIYLYHYAHLFPRQVLQKAQIYQYEKIGRNVQNYLKVYQWAQNNYIKLGDPYHVERHYSFASWLNRFDGEHPAQVQQMMADIDNGIIKEDLREITDVEELLNSKRYWINKNFLIFWDFVDRFWQWLSYQKLRASHVPGKIMKLLQNSQKLKKNA